MCTDKCGFLFACFCAALGHEAPSSSSGRGLFGLGKSNPVVLPVEDGVILADEHVS